MAPLKNKGTGPRLPNALKGASAPAKGKKRRREEGEEGDVYEYGPAKHRRAGVKLSLDKEEAIGGGKSSGDEGETDYRAMAKRIADVNEEGGEIESGDDEEIESDGAFEESDEERFAGFSWTSDRNKKRTKTKKNGVAGKKGPAAEVNLDEDEFDGKQQDNADAVSDQEDEEEEGDSDEFLDVLDVLDGRAKPYLEEEEKEEEWSGLGNGKETSEQGGGKRREGKKQRWKKRDRIAKG